MAKSRAANSLRVTRAADELQGALSLKNGQARFHNVEHHRAHMASAFFCSPFEKAAIASIDGFGDFSSAMWGVGEGNRFRVDGAVRFPHSLGLFYTPFTQFLGYRNYVGDYKVIGYAAY